MTRLCHFLTELIEQRRILNDVRTGPSSETQGQSIGSGEKVERKFSSTGVRAKERLGTDSQRTISKNSSGYRLLIGHKKCFVLLCRIGEQFLLSSFREFVHDGYCLATLARKKLPMSRKNVWNAISWSNWIWPEYSVFDGSQCIVNNRKFKTPFTRAKKIGAARRIFGNMLTILRYGTPNFRRVNVSVPYVMRHQCSKF